MVVLKERDNLASEAKDSARETEALRAKVARHLF